MLIPFMRNLVSRSNYLPKIGRTEMTKRGNNIRGLYYSPRFLTRYKFWTLTQGRRIHRELN
jgi:hypothetical protein